MVSAVDRQDASGSSTPWAAFSSQSNSPRSTGSDALTFDFSSGPVVLPVLSRIAPVRVSLYGAALTGARSHQKAFAKGVFVVNEVTRGEQHELRLSLSRYVTLSLRPHAD